MGDGVSDGAIDRGTVAVATDDLLVGEGAVLSGSFGVLLVGSRKRIAMARFYALQDDMRH